MMRPVDLNASLLPAQHLVCADETLSDRGASDAPNRDTFARLVQVERTALPSLHWLQGTLGMGLMSSALIYGAVGGGTAVEEGLARSAVVLGSHWYVAGVKELWADALGAQMAGRRQATAAAAAALGAWVGLLGSTALLGSTFRSGQYAGLAAYHAAIMVASTCLRHSYQQQLARTQAAAAGAALGRHTSWAIGAAAVVACASIAAGGTFWLTSRGSSVGALAAGGAGFHAIIGACRAMGLMQIGALFHSPTTNRAQLAAQP